MRNHYKGLSFRKTSHLPIHTAHLHPRQIMVLSPHKTSIWANTQISHLPHHLAHSRYQILADLASQLQARLVHQALPPSYRALHHPWHVINVLRCLDLLPGEIRFPIAVQAHRHRLSVIYFKLWRDIYFLAELFISLTYISLHTNGSTSPSI